MSEPSKVHSLKFAKTSHLSCFRHLLEAIPLMCPFSVLIRCETLIASLALIVLSNLHDTEDPRGLLKAL